MDKQKITEEEMAKFVLFSDSSCDLTVEIARDLDIHIVPFYVSFDGARYFKERVDITNDEFYERLRGGIAKTSLPPLADYAEAFRFALESGQDVLCICLSSKFSGSFQSACAAKLMLEDEFKDRNIVIVDSYTATLGQGLLVLEAVKMRDDNITALEAANILEQMKLTGKLYFTLDSLEHLQKGGRIGKVSALAGMLLNIKPIIVLDNGELLPHSKVRGKRKGMTRIMELTQEYIGESPRDYTVMVLHSNVLEDAKVVKAELASDYNIKTDLPILAAGSTVGAHAGPTAVGIAMVRNYESYKR